MNKIKTYLKLTLSCIVFLLVKSNTNAQKGHFTQFYNSPLVFNSAETGNSEKLRIVSNYRMQWQKIGTGITTQALSIDLPVGKFGMGLLAHSNNAGQGSLQRNNVLFFFSKYISLNTNTRLGFGVQAGLLQYQLSDNLTFDSQYSSQIGYDPSLDNGESFYKNRFNKLDGGIGIILENIGFSWKPKLSIALNQLIPSQNIFSDSKNSNNFGLINSSFELRKYISPKIELIPYFMLFKQNKAKDIQLGSRISYNFIKDQKIQLGAGLRSKDAFCSYIAYGYKSSLLGLSYDANYSGLQPASEGVGAWEISLKICFDRKKKNKPIKEDTLSTIVLSPKVSVPEDSLKTQKVSAQVPVPLKSPQRDSTLLEQNEIGGKREAVSEKEIEYNSINPNQIQDRLFVYFDQDKSLLKALYKTNLGNFVKQLENKKEFKILVSGHTDSDGDSMYNIYLSQSRAQEVLKYLVELGVPVDNIKIFTYGKTNPATENTDEMHKALNRRVELLLITK